MTTAEEAQLLYELLKAAESETRMRNLPVEKKWRALRHRVSRSNCATAHSQLTELFAELDRTDAIVGTWIEFKWRSAKGRGEKANGFSTPEHATKTIAPTAGESQGFI